MIKIPKNLRGTTGVVNSGDAGGVFDRGADWGVIWREFFHVPATPSILKHPHSPARGNAPEKHFSARERGKFSIATRGKKVFAFPQFERPVRLMVRTAEPHSENSGSIPLRGATFARAEKARFFVFRAGNFSRIA